MTGMDLMEERQWDAIAGRSVGIITNHTAINSAGRHLADILYDHPDIELKAIFAPEHGFRGDAEAGARIDDDRDARTGAPVYSIYGKTRKPTPEMLNGVELLAFDIQDIGARFYTYISTMGYGMEAAAENNIPFIVLDRPNPISGKMAGPLLDTLYRSFVGNYPIPIQHGLSVGELARMIKGENWTDADLTKLDLRVVPVKNWSRNSFYTDWPPPSPNIPDLQTALIYPGTCLLEATNLSEGRGTDSPFLLFGAPWLNTADLLPKLNPAYTAGTRIDTVSFIPVDMPGRAYNPKYENLKCAGLKVSIIKPENFNAIPFSLDLLMNIGSLHPDSLQLKEGWMGKLWGGPELYEFLRDDPDGSLDDFINAYRTTLEDYQILTEKYTLYP